MKALRCDGTLDKSDRKVTVNLGRCVNHFQTSAVFYIIQQDLHELFPSFAFFSLSSLSFALSLIAVLLPAVCPQLVAVEWHRCLSLDIEAAISFYYGLSLTPSARSPELVCFWSKPMFLTAALKEHPLTTTLAGRQWF